MTDLDARIRDQLTLELHELFGIDPKKRALLAVLKEHRPEWNRTRYYCTCDYPYPCSTVEAIARELGVSYE